MTIVTVNWMEDFFGDPGDRLFKFVRRVHKDIRVLKGTAATGRMFGGIHSVPGAFLFDAQGREIFRLGGKRGPSGRRQIKVHHLEEGLKKAGAKKRN